MALASILSLIGSFKDQLISTCTDVKNETEFFLNGGLPTYIESIESKFLNTKTFLYRNENMPFYDVFFPVSLRNSNVKKKVTTYNELFGTSRFVIINGTAGSGKTMLMKHFFLTSIRDYYKIPLFIELRNLNDYDGSLTDFIYEVIFNNRLSPDKRILERLLESGSFILLLDGYDEIYSTRKNKFTIDLDKFIDRYTKNNFVISSRLGSGLESFPRFDNFYLEELTTGEIFEFTDLVLKCNSDKRFAVKIKDAIKKSVNSDYSNLLKSPLLLSMFILTFNSYPELPRLKSKFYWNMFDTLTTRHNNYTKTGGYIYERKTGLKNDAFEKILMCFSYISYFEQKWSFDMEYLNTTLYKIKQRLNYDFSIDDLIQDLTLAIPIILIDGVDYKFPHRSIQEYFCALYIKSQTDEAKNKSYPRSFIEQIERGVIREDNLWDFCNELDKTGFQKHFLLPKLLEFKNMIYDPEPINQLKKFYLNIDVNGVSGFFSSTNHDISFRRRSEVTIYNLYSKIFQFLNIEGLKSLWVKGLPHDSEEFEAYFCEMAMLFGDKPYNDYYRYNIIEHWTEAATRLMVKLGFVDILNNIISQVDYKITELTQEISNEENVADHLREM